MPKTCAILPCTLGRYFTLALVVFSLAAQTVPSKNPPAGPVQPIPYSHKQHLAVGLECKNCHEMPEPSDDMGCPQPPNV
jgi:hypothetical protein